MFCRLSAVPEAERPTVMSQASGGAAGGGVRIGRPEVRPVMGRASNGDAICLTSFVVRHQRLRQRGVRVRGPRVRWIEQAERPFPVRPRWPSQVILAR